MSNKLKNVIKWNNRKNLKTESNNSKRMYKDYKNWVKIMNYKINRHKSVFYI